MIVGWLCSNDVHIGVREACLYLKVKNRVGGLWVYCTGCAVLSDGLDWVCVLCCAGDTKWAK